MVNVLRGNGKNYLLAARIYQEKYRDRKHPHRSAFGKPMQRFDETENVEYKKTNRTKMRKTNHQYM